MLYNNDETVVTLHIGGVELALIFSPAIPDVAIEGQVGLLREAGLALEDVEGLVFVDNEVVRELIAGQQALPEFLCVVDLPIYRVQGGLIWIGAEETEA
jgi:hypothetical protein